MPQERRELRPLQTSATRVVAIGTGLWALALLVLLVTGARPQWRAICLAGIGLGLLGLVLVRRRQRRT